MRRRISLQLLFYLSLTVVVVLVGYKIYLNLSIPDLQALHTQQVAQIERRVTSQAPFSFAVVGNINNSIGIFEQRIVARLNRTDVDFVVSAGNAVADGGEDKYKALQGTLAKLRKPYLLTFGPNEHEDFGAFRFYDHFGPHFYSVRVGNSRLVFLDSTGKTPWRWQIRWLEDLLRRAEADTYILFLGHPIRQPAQTHPLLEDPQRVQPPAFRSRLLELIDAQSIDMVFAASAGLYDAQTHGGTTFVTTGGAGGLVLNEGNSFYHYVRVDVDTDGTVQARVMPLQIAQHPWQKRLESLWLLIYSFFYTSYLNFILVLAFLLMITVRLYGMIFVDRDYYPDYDLDPTPWLERSLRIAMFTNNFLPFLGGVPISIDRLRRGLRAWGDRILIIAPDYGTNSDGPEPDVFRVSALCRVGKQGEFCLAHLLQPRMLRRIRAFDPEVMHVHHPFWLGSLGLWLARRRGIPAVYTYHTRLEHYAHFVPLPGRLFRNLISHALVRRFANKCDGVIVPTNSAEAYLRLIGVKRPIWVQPTGINFEAFQAVDPDAVAALRQRFQLDRELVLLSVSRLSNEKNIAFMLDAVAHLKTQTTRAFRFLIVGDGHQRRWLQQRIEQLGLINDVVLVGAVPAETMPVWYRLADLFLFASKSETQGMVILEAAAAGVPTVAIRSSGIDDVVEEGRTGFKTPTDTRQWSRQVQRLLEDDQLRRNLSAHARELARTHSLSAFRRRIRAIYAEALARRAQYRHHRQR